MEKDNITPLANFKDEVLEIYPKKVGKKRAKSIVYAVESEKEPGRE